jgi:hypothetical protein
MGRMEYFLGILLLLEYPLGTCQSTSNTQNRGDIAVLVNPSNPVNELSLSDLRRMLTGDRRYWQGNVQVKLILPEPGTWERAQVLTIVLKVNDAEFTKEWMERIFRGEATDLPPSLTSTASAERYLISTPGGITFMRAKGSLGQLKVLRLDGKLPGDSGYVLR